MKRLQPGMIELGSEYTLKVFLSDGKNELISWEIGTIKTPNSIEYKIPEIEDSFYIMPEIYTPQIIADSEEKNNSIYSLIGLVFAVVLPWISFVKMWKSSGSNFSIPSFLFNSSKSRAFPFFSASLFGLFLLIVAAWVFLSIFQTLGLLAVLSSTAFVFGHRSLKTVVQSEEKEKKSSDNFVKSD